jgi:hypothetical protein
MLAWLKGGVAREEVNCHKETIVEATFFQSARRTLEAEDNV